MEFSHSPVYGILVPFMDVGTRTHNVVRGGDMIALVMVHGVTVHMGGVARKGLVEGSVGGCGVRVVHPCHSVHGPVVGETIIVLQWKMRMN